MRSRPRVQEGFKVQGVLAWLTVGWTTWVNDVFDALGGWNSTITGSGSIDFGNIPLGFELSGMVTVKGASVGDMVNVYPTANVPGLVFVGNVTAVDTVTVYAKNVSTDFLDPPSIDFKFIILQN